VRLSGSDGVDWLLILCTRARREEKRVCGGTRVVIPGNVVNITSVQRGWNSCHCEEDLGIRHGGGSTDQECG